MEKKELNEDTVKLLRAVMKISSAFNEYDSMSFDSKYFKHKFKTECVKWSESMNKHMNELMNSLMEEDDKLLMEVYSRIDKSTEEIDAGSPDKTTLVVFYCKIKSALNDIDSMTNNRNTFYPMFIHHYTGKVVKQIEKQYKPILEVKDTEGNGCQYVIDFLDNLGEAIMFLTDKEEDGGE
jgi:hypothetical protein